MVLQNYQWIVLREEVQYLVIYFLMEIIIQELNNLFREEYLAVVEKNHLYMELEVVY